MMRRMLCILSFGIGATTFGTSAVANQQSCGSHKVVTTRLADVYGERRQAMGLGGNNTVIEVFASDESGTWSITVTQPSGQTCLVAAGQAFRLEPMPTPAEDPDA